MTDTRLSNDDIVSILTQTNAIRKGHFKLTSGRHSDTYIQCARVLEHPSITMQLAREAVLRLGDSANIDIVASPAVGGILFGFAVACALDKPLIFSERVDGQMTFRRSFEVPKDARVLVVEDVVTTGGSVKEVCDLVKTIGGRVVAVVSMIDRGANPDFGAEYRPLLALKTPSWDPDECEQCKQGITIDSPGSRRLANS